MSVDLKLCFLNQITLAQLIKQKADKRGFMCASKLTLSPYTAAAIRGLCTYVCVISSGAHQFVTHHD